MILYLYIYIIKWVNKSKIKYIILLNNERI